MNEESLTKALNTEKSCFTIGVIGGHQAGKSTFLRSSFGVPFKSNSLEIQGLKVSEGIDIGFKDLDQVRLILLDAEDFRS